MVYKWYILPIGGDGLCYRSHLLGEPETTIEHGLVFVVEVPLAGKKPKILVSNLGPLTLDVPLEVNGSKVRIGGL